MRTSLSADRQPAYVACSGLGRVLRGYESFFRECFVALKGNPSVDVTLFCGAAILEAGARPLLCVPRHSRAGQSLGWLTRRGGYFVEQFTFALSLIRQLRHLPVGPLFFSDGTVGNVLYRWQRGRQRRFPLVFSNGGPLSPPFPRWDHVHQVTQIAADEALHSGHDPERQTVIPYGFNIAPKLNPMSRRDLDALRFRLSLPVSRKIVLSVGAMNDSHKRHGHTIREIGKLTNRPYLVLLGQREHETPGIESAARETLGSDGFTMRSVQPDETGDYYRASDLMIHAALHEGFGRVLIEGLAQGVPLIAHDSPMNQKLLGPMATLLDMNDPGGLADALQRRERMDRDEGAAQRHRFAYDHYSWSNLVPRYADMLSEAKAR